MAVTYFNDKTSEIRTVPAPENKCVTLRNGVVLTLIDLPNGKFKLTAEKAK